MPAGWRAHGRVLARRAHRAYSLPTALPPAAAPLGGTPTCAGSSQQRKQSVLRASTVCATTDRPRGPVVVVDNYDSFTYNLARHVPLVCICRGAARASSRMPRRERQGLGPLR